MWLKNCSCLCAHFEVLTLYVLSTQSVRRCGTVKRTKVEVGFWGRAPENAQMGETVVINPQRARGQLVPRFPPHASVPSASPSMTSPRSPASLPAPSSSAHTTGNKVAQSTVVSSRPLPPLAPTSPCSLVVWFVWPVDLSMFHSESHHPGRYHAVDASSVPRQTGQTGS